MSKKKPKNPPNSPFKKPVPVMGKMKITLHALGNPNEGAMLLATMTDVWKYAHTYPGIVQPIHIALEFGTGADMRRVCGSIEPARDEPDDGTGKTVEMAAVLDPSKCN